MPLRLEPVRDRKLQRLVKAATACPTRKGDVLFRRGELAAHVVLVGEGHVCLQLGEEGGDLRTVAVAGPWELFGEEGMVPGALRPYTAVAGERGSVFSLEGSDVRAVLRSSQHTLTTYLEVKERELHLLRGAAGGSPGPTARQRLAVVIVDLIERLGEPEGDGTRLPHWFTHRELADLSGAHRSTVTTCLNDWIWRGVLDTRGRSFTVSRAGLQTLRGEGLGPPPSIDPTPRQD